MLDRAGSRSFLMALLVGTAPACDDGAKPGAGEAGEAGAASKAGAAKPGAGEAGAAKACGDAAGKAIEQEMLAGCGISAQVLRVEVPMAPWSASASAPPEETIRLELTREGTMVGWDRPVEAAQVAAHLTEKLKQARQMAEMTGKPVPGWGLAIAGDVPRAEVAAVFQALVDAGHAKGHLLLATKDVGTLPAPRQPEALAKMHARVDGVDPSQRATLLAKEIEQKMPPCPGVKKTFSAVATAAPDQRCPLMAKGVSEGLVACGCPDADELLTLLYGVSVGTEPPDRLSVASGVTLDPGAASRPGETWAQVVAGLDPAALGALWVATG